MLQASMGTETQSAPKMSQIPHDRVAIIVDDDDVFRNRLQRALRERGWETHAAEDGETGISLAATHSPDLAIVDLRLPGMGGLSIVKELRVLDKTICIVVLTGYGSIATALSATKLGADHYLSKPADADQILAAYQRIDSPIEEAAPTEIPSLARVEWEHIQRVLEDCEGNISKAAKLLGLHRRSLQRKLSKYPPRL
jgi:two-component system response regulator RegA